MTKVTEKQATAVLNEVAAWMGKNGYGTLICPEGRTLDYVGRHADDKSDCDDVKVGPAPTGPDAAYNGTGPMLNMDFDGGPAIILEGGPDEWAIRASYAVQKAMDAKGVKVFVEPYYSFVLSIYPN